MRLNVCEFKYHLDIELSTLLRYRPSRPWRPRGCLAVNAIVVGRTENKVIWHLFISAYMASYSVKLGKKTKLFIIINRYWIYILCKTVFTARRFTGYIMCYCKIIILPFQGKLITVITSINLELTIDNFMENRKLFSFFFNIDNYYINTWKKNKEFKMINVNRKI